MLKEEKGFVLIAVIAVAVIFAITAMAVLTIAQQEVTLNRIDGDKAAAFYLAEAGLAKMQEKLQKPFKNDIDAAIEESLETGSFNVELDTSQNPCYVTATGTSGNINQKVRVQVTFLAAPLEYAIYANNNSALPWDFQLRGKGDPVLYEPKKLRGGKDIINGNIFIDGDAYFLEESSVKAAPAPNPWDLNGDAKATGNITVGASATIEGTTEQFVEEPDVLDLVSMNYANNNTHDVAKIFNDKGVSSGYLPFGHELRDVFVKNPSDRNTECASTPGDDFFLEPSSGFIGGTFDSAPTPLHIGEDKIYFIDGDLWIHSKNDTYGFNMDGRATIVVTGNVHICDNSKYADADSMLGIVALGKHDGTGQLVSGGNIYFGDPSYGTLYMAAAMMFAANDFLFMTDSVNGGVQEPSTGFTVNGNFAALGQVSIERDWYTKTSGFSITEERPALYDPQAGVWKDALTGATLTSTQISTIRHYQMVVNYDERVRNEEIRPPGLPCGGAKIFAGFSNWQEL